MDSKIFIIPLLALALISSAYALTITSPSNNSNIFYNTTYSWAKNTSIAQSTYQYNLYLNSTLVNTYNNYYSMPDLNTYTTSSVSYVLVHTYNISTKSVRPQLDSGIWRITGSGGAGNDMYLYLLIHYTNGTNSTTEIQVYGGTEGFGNCKPVSFTQNVSTSSSITSIDAFVKSPSGFQSGICGTPNVWLLENTSNNYTTSINPYFYNLIKGNYKLNITAINYTISILDSNNIYVNLPYDSLLNVSSIYNSGLLNNYNITIDSRIFSVNNNYAMIEILRGLTYPILIDIVGYSLYRNNVTVSSNYTSFQANIQPIAINITYYNEVTGSIITSTNSTTTFSSVSPIFNQAYTFNGTGLVYNLSGGNYSLLTTNSAYSTKNSYIQIQDRTYNSLNIYLNNGNTTLFNFKQTNGNILPNTLFKVYTYVNGNLTLVESAIADVTGKVQTSLRANTYYFFEASLSGYTTYQFSLNPVLFASYDIALSPSTNGNVVPSATVSYSPTIFFMNQNSTFNIQFNSPYKSLSSYGFVMTYTNGSISGSGTNTSGQVFALPFYISQSGSDTFVTINYYYTLNNSVSMNQTFIYRVPLTYSNHTIVNFGHDSNYGLLIGDKLWILTFILIPVVGLAFIFSGSLTFALVILMLIVGMFGASGFIPIGITALVVVLCLIVLFGKGGQ